MTHYGSWEGADHAWTLIFEEFSEKKWLVNGPVSASGWEYWRDLSDEERELELKNWSEDFENEFGVAPITEPNKRNVGYRFQYRTTLARMSPENREKYYGVEGEVTGMMRAMKLCQRASDAMHNRVNRSIRNTR